MKRVRLVSFAWGEAYVGELLDFALPAVLAPGNLPALAAEFQCEFVFLTERRLFEQVERHPSFQRLRQICPARLIEIDDLLVAPLYGLSLTYASYRAFEDLGDSVTDTALLYFNSDWLLADGSYRSLIPHIKAGARLVVAPSYCAVSERTLPRVRERLAQGGGVLAVPPREMADWAIRYRHNTIRGKTVNSRVFHMNVIDQLYWRADARTLLCHQMPIAIVCISPERFMQKPETFWDYGIVSELCPNATPVVLGDSDDFLMLELRSEETYAEGLRIGWPRLDEIGRHLASFVTKDHLDYGRFQLCLHSGDLPAGLDEARAALRRALDEVYAQIPAPQDYRGHSFWWPQKTLFDIVRHDYQSRDVVRDWRWGYRASPYTNMIKAEIERIDREFENGRERKPDADRMLAALGGSVGVLEGLFGGDLNSLRKALQIRSHRWRRAAAGHTSTLDAAGTTSAVPPGGIARRALRWLRGRVNAPHPLHPDRLVAKDLIEALRGHPGGGANLVICSGGHDLAARVLDMLGHPASRLDLDDALAGALPKGPWNLVICDVAHADLESFRPILRRLLPMLADGAKVFLFHPSRRGALALDTWTILNAFPPTDALSVRYSGSPWTDFAIRLYDRTARVLPKVPVAGFNLTPFAALALAAPAVLIASLRERFGPAQEGDRPPLTCASMLLALSVNADVRAELDGW